MILNKIADKLPLNWPLLSNPINWVLIWVMIGLGYAGLKLITTSADTSTKDEG